MVSYCSAIKSVVLEGFTKLLSQSFGQVNLYVGLTFANIVLNMVAVYFSPSKFDIPENKEYKGHLPKLIFGLFYVVTRFSTEKQHFTKV